VTPCNEQTEKMSKVKEITRCGELRHQNIISVL
jgi:hypothetical protein